MIYNRIRSMLAKKKDIGLIEGVNSLIPGKNGKGDIIAYWIFVGCVVMIIIIIAALKVYNILNHFFNTEI